MGAEAAVVEGTAADDGAGEDNAGDGSAGAEVAIGTDELAATPLETAAPTEPAGAAARCWVVQPEITNASDATTTTRRAC